MGVCKYCGGKGVVICDRCEGSGCEEPVLLVFVQACVKCHNRRYVPCPCCNGKGRN
jgi:hypothetical protein